LGSTVSTERPVASRVSLPLRLTGIQIALCALAAYPAFRLGGREGLQSMLLGAGLGWATIVASYIGLMVAFRRAKRFSMVVVVLGFMVRLVVLFGLLRLLMQTMPIDLDRVVLWTVSFYFVLVIAEAWILAENEKRRPEI